MQKKIGTIINEALLKKAKEKAVAQHTTLNHIFEQALAEYLSRQIPDKQKLSAVEASFGAIALPVKVAQKIAEEELYETD